MSCEKWEQRQSNRRKRTDTGSSKAQKNREGGAVKGAAGEKKIRAEGAADEKADREADREGGGSIIRPTKQNCSRRCTETAFAPYIYKVYKSMLKNGAWKDAKWLSAREGLP